MAPLLERASTARYHTDISMHTYTHPGARMGAHKYGHFNLDNNLISFAQLVTPNMKNKPFALM